LIAEWVDKRGQRHNAKVFSETNKSVVVWFPGRKCKRCEGYAHVIQERQMQVKNKEGHLSMKPVKSFVKCPDCKGDARSEKWNRIKLKKSQVHLRDCAPLVSNYSYYAPSNEKDALL